jgi:chitin synthase
MATQAIPNMLKNLSAGQVITTFLKPPVGSLIVAMVSTFGAFNRYIVYFE